MFAKIAQGRQDAKEIPISERAGRGPLPESLCPSISPSPRRAFTLIELMVVIGIIGLLIAIVVPAISAARDRAKELTTKAAIGTLETGLEQYRADTRLDGDYPPSVFTTLAKSPYRTDNDNTKIMVCGANLLVWGMAGADLLGTPGFRNLDRSNSSSTANDIYHDPFGGWCSDTGAGVYTVNNVDKPRLYTIAGGQPAISRSGPFVDVSKMKMSEYVPADQTFRIPTANIDANPLFSYCFLDSFNQPILYYKANPKAPYMVDAGRSLALASTNNSDYVAYQGVNTGSYTPSGVYNLLDNALITGITNSSSGNQPIQGMDFGAGGAHRIAMVGASIGASGFEYQGTLPGSFAYMVRNPNINPVVGMRDTGTGLFSPHNSDKYILLSPGIDGIFGTADDIGNFPINKD